MTQTWTRTVTDLIIRRLYLWGLVPDPERVRRMRKFTEDADRLDAERNAATPTELLEAPPGWRTVKKRRRPKKDDGQCKLWEPEPVRGMTPEIAADLQALCDPATQNHDRIEAASRLAPGFPRPVNPGTWHRHEGSIIDVLRGCEAIGCTLESLVTMALLFVGRGEYLQKNKIRPRAEREFAEARKAPETLFRYVRARVSDLVTEYLVDEERFRWDNYPILSQPKERMSQEHMSKTDGWRMAPIAGGSSDESVEDVLAADSAPRVSRVPEVVGHVIYAVKTVTQNHAYDVSRRPTAHGKRQPMFNQSRFLDAWHAKLGLETWGRHLANSADRATILKHTVDQLMDEFGVKRIPAELLVRSRIFKEPQADLAREYGMSHGAVRQAVKRAEDKVWAHQDDGSRFGDRAYWLTVKRLERVHGPLPRLNKKGQAPQLLMRLRKVS